MKLKTFNRLNSQRKAPGKPTVRIARNGTFAFNKSAAALLGITAKKFVNVLQDQENPRDWYLQLTDADDGFSPRQYKTGYIFGASDVASKIFDSINFPKAENSIALPIATEPVDGCYAIITSYYKNPITEL